MPKNNQEVKLIMSVARDMGIRMSNRMASKASMAMDRIDDRKLEIPDIEAFLRFYSDPTGETAIKHAMDTQPCEHTEHRTLSLVAA